jgi:hypothetical protein
MSIEFDSDFNLEDALNKVAQQNNIWDVKEADHSDWYADRHKIGSAKVQVLGKDGLIGKVLGTIDSDDDIIKIMLQNNLIKAGAVSNELKKQYGLDKPQPVKAPTVLPTETIAAEAPTIKDEDELASSFIHQEPTEEQVEYVKKVATNSTQNVKVKQIVKEKKVADFSSIKMNWLKEKPVEPEIKAEFSSDIGTWETYYHNVFVSEAIIYLCFDKRCRFGRFVPKLGNGMVTMQIEDKQYKGALFASAAVDIGVLSITPFILAFDNDDSDLSSY